jgi:hypothetical protein
MKNQLNDILNRLAKLEAAVFGEANKGPIRRASSKKPVTIIETVKGKNFRNGQTKVAFIVGYLEKIEKNVGIKEKDIKQAWRDGKMDGIYVNELLRRAIKDALVRDLKDGTFDLTHTGELYFYEKLKE